MKAVILVRRNLSGWAIVLLIITLFAANSCRETDFKDGEHLYKLNCANCHMDDGKGLNKLIPPLAGSDFLGKNRDKLPCIIRAGLRDTISVNGQLYAEQMAGIPTIKDVAMTNILNYINTSWGNNLPLYRVEEVRTALEQCK